MKTITFKVPVWFADLGFKTDAAIAREHGILANGVSACRCALGIEPFCQNKRRHGYLKNSERWRKYLRLRKQKIPPTSWPDALGFGYRFGLTPKECMEEWIYCHTKKLTYNPRYPHKRHLRIKVTEAHAKVRERTKHLPNGSVSEDMIEHDNELLNIEDL